MSDLEFLATITGSDTSEINPLIGSPLQPEHVLQLSRAQEYAGFDGTLVTESSTSAHAFVLGAQVLAATERMRVIVAARPGVTAPTSLQRAVATLDAFHPDRIGLHVPPVDNDAEYRREGDRTTRTERQARRREYLDLLGVLARARLPVNYAGAFYRLDGAWTAVRPRHPVPVYLSGLSTAADEVAACSADVYLLPAEPTAQVRDRIARVRAVAGTRKIRFGLRLRPLIGTDPADAERLADRVLRTRRVGETRALKNATGALDDARELIGTSAHIAETLLRYAAMGVTVFQLRGYAPRADVERFAELVSLVRRRASGVRGSDVDPVRIPA